MPRTDPNRIFGVMRTNLERLKRFGFYLLPRFLPKRIAGKLELSDGGVVIER